MKFVLFVLALLLLLWLIKRTLAPRRPPAPPRPEAARDPSGAPLPMVTCAVCGLHLPRHESLPGRGGVFCGEAHRAEFEKKHPPS
jgi:uncharacterized protein